MKKWDYIFWVCFILLLSVSVFAAIVRNAPEDKFPIAQMEDHPGRQAYRVDFSDPNGNYEGNYLLLKMHGNIGRVEIYGTVVHTDPNYLRILDAVPDVNDPNMNLEGSIWYSKAWPPGEYELGFQVFDCALNSDCKWFFLSVVDGKPPKVEKLEKK